MMKKITLLFAFVAAAISALYAQSDQIITSIPEGGTEKLYNRSSRSYYRFELSPLADDDNNFAQRLYFYENGDVYLFKPFNSMDDNDVYLKGHMEGDNKIVFPLPQPVCVMRDGNEEQVMSAARLVYKQEFKNLKPADDQNLVFNIDDDGVISMEGDYGSLNTVVVLGVVNPWDMWIYYGEQCMQLIPVNEEDLNIVTLPENVKMQEWKLTTLYSQYYLEVGFDNDDVYIRGLYPEMPKAVIKGKVKGDKVVFPDGQYLGIGWDHFLYCLSVTREKVWNEEFNTWLSQTQWLEETEFTYNAENEELVTDQGFMINAGNNGFMEVVTIEQPALRGPNSKTIYTDLADPEVLGYIEWSEREGEEWDPYGTFACILYPLDQNKNYLDTENLYYEVFFNNEDEAYEFTTREYDRLKHNMKIFPYQFDNELNFRCRNTNQHYVYFWRPDVDRIGMRTVYIADDGNTYYSRVAYSDGSFLNKPATSRVGQVIGDKVVSGIEYYDIAGRRIVNPEHGMYIRVTRFNDGTVSSEKFAK